MQQGALCTPCRHPHLLQLRSRLWGADTSDTNMKIVAVTQLDDWSYDDW